MEALSEVLTVTSIKPAPDQCLPHLSIAPQLPNQVLEYMQYKKFKAPSRDAVDLHAQSQERALAREECLSERKESDVEAHAAEAGKVCKVCW